MAGGDGVMAQRGAEGVGEGLTQTLGEKMAAVIGRYGAERPNARRCVVCGEVVADPLMAGHLEMHDQVKVCPICGQTGLPGDLDKHLAHLRASAEHRPLSSTQCVCGQPVGHHRHGEPTPEQRVVGEAVKAVITAELDGLELVAQKLYEKQTELAYLFGFGGGQWSEAVPWGELKARHRAWLVATVSELIKDGVLRCG
jgi:hypothetical protein